MERTFADYMEMGVSLFVTAAFISSIGLTVSLSQRYNEKQVENAAAAAQFKEERVNIFYNDTNVYQQDIVSLISKYKGERAVRIVLKNNDVLQWSAKSSSSDYKLSSIGNLIPRTSLYKSSIQRGPDGSSVVGYMFVEI